MAELDVETAYQSWLDEHGVLTDTDWVHESFVAGWNAALRERLRAALKRIAGAAAYAHAQPMLDADIAKAALEGRDG